MPRKRARNTEGEFLGDNPATPEVNEAWAEETEAPVAEVPAPANLEVTSPDPEPTPVTKVPEKVEIETDVRTKLDKRTSEKQDPFVPQNSAKLEAEAKKIAKEKGFELNQGTSIGARLMARRLLG
jgi:hypothetical protein